MSHDFTRGKMSDIYVGAVLLKKLKAIAHVSLFNLSFIGSKSVSSFFPRYSAGGGGAGKKYGTDGEVGGGK